MADLNVYNAYDAGAPGAGFRTSALLGPFVKTLTDDGGAITAVVQLADNTEATITFDTGGGGGLAEFFPGTALDADIPIKLPLEPSAELVETVTDYQLDFGAGGAVTIQRDSLSGTSRVKMSIVRIDAMFVPEVITPYDHIATPALNTAGPTADSNGGYEVELVYGSDVQINDRLTLSQGSAVLMARVSAITHDGTTTTTVTLKDLHVITTGLLEEAVTRGDTSRTFLVSGGTDRVEAGDIFIVNGTALGSVISVTRQTPLAEPDPRWTVVLDSATVTEDLPIGMPISFIQQSDLAGAVGDFSTTATTSIDRPRAEEIATLPIQSAINAPVNIDIIQSTATLESDDGGASILFTLNSVVATGADGNDWGLHVRFGQAAAGLLVLSSPIPAAAANVRITAGSDYVDTALTAATGAAGNGWTIAFAVSQAADSINTDTPNRRITFNFAAATATIADLITLYTTVGSTDIILGGGSLGGSSVTTNGTNIDATDTFTFASGTDEIPAQTVLINVTQTTRTMTELKTVLDGLIFTTPNIISRVGDVVGTATEEIGTNTPYSVDFQDGLSTIQPTTDITSDTADGATLPVTLDGDVAAGTAGHDWQMELRFGRPRARFAVLEDAPAENAYLTITAGNDFVVVQYEHTAGSSGNGATIVYQELSTLAAGRVAFAASADRRQLFIQAPDLSVTITLARLKTSFEGASATSVIASSTSDGTGVDTSLSYTFANGVDAIADYRRVRADFTETSLTMADLKTALDSRVESNPDTIAVGDVVGTDTQTIGGSSPYTFRFAGGLDENIAATEKVRFTTDLLRIGDELRLLVAGLSATITNLTVDGTEVIAAFTPPADQDLTSGSSVVVSRQSYRVEVSSGTIQAAVTVGNTSVVIPTTDVVRAGDLFYPNTGLPGVISTVAHNTGTTTLTLTRGVSAALSTTTTFRVVRDLASRLESGETASDIVATTSSTPPVLGSTEVEVEPIPQELVLANLRITVGNEYVEYGLNVPSAVGSAGNGWTLAFAVGQAASQVVVNESTQTVTVQTSQASLSFGSLLLVTNSAPEVLQRIDNSASLSATINHTQSLIFSGGVDEIRFDAQVGDIVRIDGSQRIVDEIGRAQNLVLSSAVAASQTLTLPVGTAPLSTDVAASATLNLPVWETLPVAASVDLVIPVVSGTTETITLTHRTAGTAGNGVTVRIFRSNRGQGEIGETDPRALTYEYLSTSIDNLVAYINTGTYLTASYTGSNGHVGLIHREVSGTLAGGSEGVPGVREASADLSLPVVTTIDARAATATLSLPLGTGIKTAASVDVAIPVTGGGTETITVTHRTAGTVGNGVNLRITRSTRSQTNLVQTNPRSIVLEIDPSGATINSLVAILAAGSSTVLTASYAGSNGAVGLNLPSEHVVSLAGGDDGVTGQSVFTLTYHTLVGGNGHQVRFVATADGTDSATDTTTVSGTLTTVSWDSDEGRTPGQVASYINAGSSLVTATVVADSGTFNTPTLDETVTLAGETDATQHAGHADFTFTHSSALVAQSVAASADLSLPAEDTAASAASAEVSLRVQTEGEQSATADMNVPVTGGGTQGIRIFGDAGAAAGAAGNGWTFTLIQGTPGAGDSHTENSTTKVATYTFDPSSTGFIGFLVIDMRDAFSLLDFSFIGTDNSLSVTGGASAVTLSGGSDPEYGAGVLTLTYATIGTVGNDYEVRLATTNGGTTGVTDDLQAGRTTVIWDEGDEFAPSAVIGIINDGSDVIQVTGTGDLTDAIDPAVTDITTTLAGGAGAIATASLSLPISAANAVAASAEVEIPVTGGSTETIRLIARTAGTAGNGLSVEIRQGSSGVGASGSENFQTIIYEFDPADSDTIASLVTGFNNLISGVDAFYFGANGASTITGGASAVTLSGGVSAKPATAVFTLSYHEASAAGNSHQVRFLAATGQTDGAADTTNLTTVSWDPAVNSADTTDIVTYINRDSSLVTATVDVANGNFNPAAVDATVSLADGADPEAGSIDFTFEHATAGAAGNGWTVQLVATSGGTQAVTEDDQAKTTIVSWDSGDGLSGQDVFNLIFTQSAYITVTLSSNGVFNPAVLDETATLSGGADDPGGGSGGGGSGGGGSGGGSGSGISGGRVGSAGGDNTTFVNNITRGDVSLFMEQLLLAPRGTTWTPGRINVASPPAGFVHMGAVRDDSPQLTIQKENFQLATGIPMVLRYQTTMRIVGEFQIVLHSNRNSRLITALGGLPAYHFSNSPTLWPAIASHGSTSATAFHVTSTAAVATWKTGQLLVHDTATKINKTLNEAFLKRNPIADPSTMDYPLDTYKVSVEGPQAFPQGVTHGNDIFRIDKDEVLLGTNVIPYYHLLGVADGVDGVQIVHQMKLASPRGQFVETLRNGQDAQIPGIFDLFGYSASTPHSTRTHVVVASRHWFGI